MKKSRVYKKCVRNFIGMLIIVGQQGEDKIIMVHGEAVFCCRTSASSTGFYASLFSSNQVYQVFTSRSILYRSRYFR